MKRALRVLVLVAVALGLRVGLAAAATKEVIIVTSFPTEWDTFAKTNYARAKEAAEQAGAAIR